MPPKVKFSKEEIVCAALNVVREKGVGALTAREVAAKLGVSTRPVFTYFASMAELKRAVYEAAQAIYRVYVEKGLTQIIPFLGAGNSHIRFAQEEPELYKVLFLTHTADSGGVAMESMQFVQNLVRDSVMRTYKVDSRTAENYYRNLWLMAFSFGMLIVTNDCPYTDEQMERIFGEVSLALCKAYKEIPGFSRGDFDASSLFTELLKE